jgi:hypothetical protein
LRGLPALIASGSPACVRLIDARSSVTLLAAILAQPIKGVR